MLFKNAELFGVAEMRPAADGGAGYDLLRVPQSILPHLNETARAHTCHYTAGVEIRFVIRSGTAKVTLRTAPKCAGDTAPEALGIVTYYGGIQAGAETYSRAVRREETTLELHPPKNLPALEKLTLINGYPFSPQVVRLLLPPMPTVLVDIEGDIRPPEEEEVPPLKGLMYGSSITGGMFAAAPHTTVSALLGRAMKADMLNFGFAGSCYIEGAMADYIAARADADFIVAELGINMLGLPTDEFARRVQYFIDTVATSHAGKYVIVTDIFYCGRDMTEHATVNTYRDIVRTAVEASEYANVHHIPGLELLGSSSGLSADLTHPSSDGIAEIAKNLAAKLEEITAYAEEE